MWGGGGGGEGCGGVGDEGMPDHQGIILCESSTNQFLELVNLVRQTAELAAVES